jgi:hypothetical protein
MVEALARAHEVKIVGGDETLRREGLGFQENYSKRQPDGLGMTEEDMRLYRFTIDFLDKERRDAAARMRPHEDTRGNVDEALRSRGIELARDEPARRELDLRFTTAERRAFDTISARLNGEVIPTPTAPAETGGLQMREALKRWSEGGGRGAKKPRERTNLRSQIGSRPLCRASWRSAYRQRH